VRDASKSPSFALNERAAAVLNGVLETYLASGLPVGSRALSEMRSDSPSSATIRHVLAELEQEGFLQQPHTSAGRIPTSKAIRWWLQQLEAPTPLASDDGRRLEHLLREAHDEAAFWVRASEFLAEVTHQLGVVAVQPWNDAGLKHLRFFRLTDHRVLAILVAADGQVRERVGRVPEPYTQPELDEAARYMNRSFPGATLARIRRELMHRLEEERAAYDTLLKRVLVLSHCGVLEMQDTGAVYMHGASHLAGVLEAQPLSELLARLQQKERWLRLLNQVSPDEATIAWEAGQAGPGPRRRVQVEVGLEREQLPEFSLISTNYRRQGTDAAIAILGSHRMEYPRALAAITLVSDLFHRLLDGSPV